MNAELLFSENGKKKKFYKFILINQINKNILKIF